MNQQLLHNYFSLSNMFRLHSFSHHQGAHFLKQQAVFVKSVNGRSVLHLLWQSSLCGVYQLIRGYTMNDDIWEWTRESFVVCVIYSSDSVQYLEDIRILTHCHRPPENELASSLSYWQGKETLKLIDRRVQFYSVLFKFSYPVSSVDNGLPPPPILISGLTPRSHNRVQNTASYQKNGMQSERTHDK
jgi:hypothetical protein